MSKKIHKLGGKKHMAHGVYAGFGQYMDVVGPVCEGGNGLWRGRSFDCSRFWKDVTCKHCLNKRGKV